MKRSTISFALWLLLGACLVEGHKSGHILRRIKAYDNVRGLLHDAERGLGHEGIAFDASPDYIHAMENLTIKWDGIRGANGDDIIALYAEDGTPNHFNVEDVFAFQFCNATSTCETGSGVMVFPYIPNVRRNFRFVYFNKPGIVYTQIAESNWIQCNNTAPLQGHLALTSDASEMRLTWVSNSSTPTPTVQYGTSPDQLVNSVEGTSYTYSIDQMCGAPANISGNFLDPGFFHDAVMTGLAPATEYYYRFGDEQGGWSPVREFRSAPGSGNVNQMVKFIAYGDLGVSDCGFMNGWCESASSTTYVRVKKEAPRHDLVLHIGDISYAVGYGVRWEQFFHQLEPIATRVPYMVAMGNHEFDFASTKFESFFNGTDSGGECGIPFLARFRMPGFPSFSEHFNYGNKSTQTDLTATFYYSFDYGPIHFVVISTEQDFTPGSDQYLWLAEDLVTVDRKRTPWVVLGGHRAMYVSSNSTGQGRSGDNQVSEALRESLEEVIVKYGVDLCLWGHTHLYERSCPMVHNGTCAEGNFDEPKLRPPFGAPVHVVVGMAGFSLSHNLAYPAPNWSVFRVDQAHGFASVTVHNSTALQFKFIGDTTGSIHDEFWILKE